MSLFLRPKKQAKQQKHLVETLEEDFFRNIIKFSKTKPKLDPLIYEIIEKSREVSEYLDLDVLSILRKRKRKHHLCPDVHSFRSVVLFHV